MKKNTINAICAEIFLRTKQQNPFPHHKLASQPPKPYHTQNQTTYNTQYQAKHDLMMFRHLVGKLAPLQLRNKKTLQRKKMNIISQHIVY